MKNVRQAQILKSFKMVGLSISGNFKSECLMYTMHWKAIRAFLRLQHLIPIETSSQSDCKPFAFHRCQWSAGLFLKSNIESSTNVELSQLCLKGKYIMSEEWKDMSISRRDRLWESYRLIVRPDSCSANVISKKQNIMPWLNVHIVQLYCEQAWNDSLTCSSGLSAPRTARPRSVDGSRSCDTCDNVCLCK